jgi:serine/threonine-protein kinase RsbT
VRSGARTLPAARAIGVSRLGVPASRGKEATVTGAVRVAIRSDEDIVVARERVRELAQPLGFTQVEITMIATAISELARNIVMYAGRGEIELGVEKPGNGRQAIVVIARDEGPGIDDVDAALRVGYSTSGQLGIGLPGVRRLMDDFRLESARGKGTVVIARKWHTGMQARPSDLQGA